MYFFIKLLDLLSEEGFFFLSSLCFSVTLCTLKFLLYIYFSSCFWMCSLEFLTARFCLLFYQRIPDLKKNLSTATQIHHCMKIVIFMENPKLKNRFCEGEYTNDPIQIPMCSFTKRPVLADQYMADISVGKYGSGSSVPSEKEQEWH